MNGLSTNEKVLGEERRQLIVKALQATTSPISGTKLGDMMNVSRQVIVGDVTLLKALGEPIIATSRGYIYMHAQDENNKIESVIVCNHAAHETETELNIFVDHGVTVKDVKVEHPLYGDLTASVMVANRTEVKRFIEHIRQTNASLLLELTEGVHLHTVSANSAEQIEEAKKELKKAGILVSE